MLQAPVHGNSSIKKPTPCIGGQDPFAKQDPIGTYDTFCPDFTEESGTD